MLYPRSLGGGPAKVKSYLVVRETILSEHMYCAVQDSMGLMLSGKSEAMQKKCENINFVILFFTLQNKFGEMGRVCCCCWCNAREERNVSSFKFFSFPKTREQRERWLNFVTKRSGDPSWRPAMITSQRMVQGAIPGTYANYTYKSQVVQLYMLGGSLTHTLTPTDSWTISQFSCQDMEIVYVGSLNIILEIEVINFISTCPPGVNRVH